MFAIERHIPFSINSVFLFYQIISYLHSLELLSSIRSSLIFIRFSVYLLSGHWSSAFVFSSVILISFSLNHGFSHSFRRYFPGVHFNRQCWRKYWAAIFSTRMWQTRYLSLIYKVWFITIYSFSQKDCFVSLTLNVALDSPAPRMVIKTKGSALVDFKPVERKGMKQDQ